MSTSTARDGRAWIDDTMLDTMVAVDPNEPGCHYARLVDSGHHVWAILAGLRGNHNDIEKTTRDWHISEGRCERHCATMSVTGLSSTRSFSCSRRSERQSDHNYRGESTRARVMVAPRSIT
jgi:hypothetical protein